APWLALVGAAEAASFDLSPCGGRGRLGGGAHGSRQCQRHSSPTRPARQHSWRAFVGARANGSQARVLTSCLRRGGSKARGLRRSYKVRVTKDGPVLAGPSVHTYRRQTRLPRSSETTARIRKTTNRIQAMLLAAPAMPENPSTAAMTAITKNTMA